MHSYQPALPFAQVHAFCVCTVFPVSTDIADSGLQIRVEDTSPYRNPNALGLYVYAGDITVDLSTEYKSEFTTDGVNSIVISSHDLKECVYHALVQCTSNSAATYRVVAQLTPAYVGSLGVHGYLCGGAWAYHYVALDSALAEGHNSGHGRRQLGGLSGQHVRFHVVLHTGMTVSVSRIRVASNRTCLHVQLDSCLMHCCCTL